jgi:hypothetical protein
VHLKKLQERCIEVKVTVAEVASTVAFIILVLSGVIREVAAFINLLF